ncbi:hypothetical protein D1AOALGA4SA_10340 [Olavius algarvensis Delta 1 endosymbiont]|nr:hypothetical protein D1AOALGA4SA_10340 [Olavius algarvensis Delta 1 endosymbiont]
MGKKSTYFCPRNQHYVIFVFKFLTFFCPRNQQFFLKKDFH